MKTMTHMHGPLHITSLIHYMRASVIHYNHADPSSPTERHDKRDVKEDRVSNVTSEDDRTGGGAEHTGDSNLKIGTRGP